MALQVKSHGLVDSQIKTVTQATLMRPLNRKQLRLTNAEMCWSLLNCELIRKLGLLAPSSVSPHSYLYLFRDSSTSFRIRPQSETLR